MNASAIIANARASQSGALSAAARGDEKTASDLYRRAVALIEENLPELSVLEVLGA